MLTAPVRTLTGTMLKSASQRAENMIVHVTLSRSPIRLLIALMFVAAGLRWIWNSNPLSGPVVMTLSRTHGIHSNDWLTFVLWGAAIVAALPGLAQRLWVVGVQRRLQPALTRR